VLWLLRICGGAAAASFAGAGAWRGGTARARARKARRGCRAWERGHGEVRWLDDTAALGNSASWRRIETEDEESRDPNVRLKMVKSAFYSMTGRSGHMTGRGGGSVRSQSSKLLERPDASDYARSDADRVRSYFARKTKMHDRTRWWWPGPDAVVSRDASDAVSGHRSWRSPSNDRTRWWTPGPDAVVKQNRVRCSVRSSVRSLLNAFFNPIFNATSPNQVPIQRDSNKHQLEPDMSDLTQTLKIF
jgi:hypothetical protein